MRAVRRRPKFPDLSGVSGASSQFLVMFMGSSTTEGYKASNENANYVSQFAAKLVESSMNSIAKQQVQVWQRPVPAPGDETIGSGTGWGVSAATIKSYNPGLFFFNAGMSGKNSGSDTNGYYQPGKQQQLVANLQPDVIIHMIGANDFKDQMPLATYLSNLQFVVDDVRAKTGGKTRHLFVHSYQRLDFVPPNGGNLWTDYLGKLRELCNTNLDCNYVEIMSDFATLGVVPGAAYPNAYIQDDGIHATDLGYQKTAEFLVNKTRMLSYRGRPIFGFSADECGGNGTAVASVSASYDLVAPLEGNAAVQSTSAKRPVVVTGALNGHSILQFDGNTNATLSDCLDLNLSRSYGLPITVFFVIKQYGSAGAADGSFVSRADGTHYGYLYGFGRYRTGNKVAELTFLSNEGTNAAVNPLPIATDTPRIIGVVFKAGVTSDVYCHSLNPVRQSIPGFLPTDAPMITSMRIGSNTGQTNSANMQLAEFLAVQGELTQAEINAQMQAYADKYLLTLDTNYTAPIQYVGNATTRRTSAGTSQAISTPASTKIGDVLIVVMSATSASFATPSGWTKLQDGAGTATNNVAAAIFTRTATADGVTSYTFTKTGSAYIALGMTVWRYATVVSSAITNGGNSTNVVDPSITANGYRLVVINVLRIADTASPTVYTWTPPNGMTEVLDSYAQEMAYMDNPPNPTGNLVAVPSYQVSNWGAMSFSVLLK